MLGLLARGRANKEIAQALRCSVRTIEVYVSRILLKSGGDCRAAAIARLHALG